MLPRTVAMPMLAQSRLVVRLFGPHLPGGHRDDPKADRESAAGDRVC